MQQFGAGLSATWLLINICKIIRMHCTSVHMEFSFNNSTALCFGLASAFWVLLPVDLDDNFDDDATVPPARRFCFSAAGFFAVSIGWSSVQFVITTNINITRCVIVIDDHEASPSSSDCITLRSDTRSPVIKMALMRPSISAVILRVKVMNCERLVNV